MDTIKAAVKRIPGAKELYRWARTTGRSVQRRLMSREELFTRYAVDNTWGDADSLSGVGSNREQTRILVEAMPGLLRRLGITSLLDAPCGDFHWMQHVPLDGVSYVGADIVEALIAANQRFAGPSRSFRKLDLVKDSLPRVDAVLVRDCLVHFPLADIRRALANVCDSGARILLTTTFPAHAGNHDIRMGDWRPLNFARAPFSFPEPMELLVEGCTEGNLEYADKALGAWQIDDVRTWLAR